MKKKYVPYRTLVIYHNRFNLISLKDLSTLENNLLFSIFNQMKYNNTEFFFSLTELKEMIGGYKNLTNTDVLNIASSLENKFFNLNFGIISPERSIKTHLFSQMILEYEKDSNNFKGLTIVLDNNAIDIFQRLKREFTSFDLQIFKNLKSKYTKSLFRLLSQFASIGKFQMNYKEFREYLGVSTNYEHKMFNNKILYPSVKELSIHFPKLDVEITRYKENGVFIHKDVIFTFTPFKNHSNEFIEVIKKDNDRKSLFALKVVSNELMKISQSKIKHNLDYSQEQIAHSVIEALRYKKSGKYTNLNETEGEIKWKSLKKK